jgi:hypothetical protein
MARIDFPSNPSDGQTLTVTVAGSNTVYTYNATYGVWRSLSSSDAYLQVANLQPALDKYLQVSNGTSLTSFDVITNTPSGNGSLVYSSSNGSFTFTPADATQGGGGVTQDTLDQYLQVANSTSFATTSSLDAYLQVANSTGFASSTDLNAYLQVANLQPQLDKYLQVANSTSFATTDSLDAYLQVANSTGFASTSDLDAYLQVANVSSYAFASEKVFTVTNDGSSAYKFYGVGTGADASQANSNPTLYLSRGEKYTFNVNASGHPFYINTTNSTGTGNAFANGVINNGAEVGNVVFTVPMNAPDTLHYNCSVHSGMNGTIYVLSQTSTDTSSLQTKADATAANNALLSLIQDRLQVANLQPQLDKYLQVANSISLASFDVLTSTPSGNGSLVYNSSNGSFTFTPANATQGGGGGVTQDTLDNYLQVANGVSLTAFDVLTSTPSGNGSLVYNSSNGSFTFTPANATQGGGGGGVTQDTLDNYLQVANGVSLTAFDVLTTTPSGNGSLVYNSSNGSFTFTPADATQGGGGGGGGASVTASDTAPSSPSAGDLWFHTTQLKLYVYYSDGSSNQWVQTNSGVGNRVDEFIKAYRYQGTLAINTGDTRLYLQDSYILKGIHAYVDTAPTGSSVITDVKKNGSSLQTITVAAGATSASNTSLSHTFVSGDYLTVDITQVGSSTAGENLYMVFTFN